MNSGAAHPDCLQSPKATRDMFSDIAPRYDDLNRVLSLGRDAAWRRALVDAVVQPRPLCVLDVATGSGDVWLALKQKLAPGSWVAGVDFCPPLLRLAAHKGARPLILGDAGALPVCDASCDAITVAFGLRNFPDRRRFLAEARRVLRPGGTLALLECSRPPQALGPAYRLFLTLLPPVYARAAGTTASAYRYLGDSILAFPGHRELAAELAAAGFLPGRIRRFMLGAVALHTVTRPA
jgi:demethylmenaquinone methyltransferase/2-methoxy-6-polyprenyl-1,4-benzoquinol methylase